MGGLEDLYKEVIMDHYRSPRNQGELPTPPATKSEGTNPLCGDEITLYTQVEDGVVTDVKMQGSGCSISQSSASMMSAAIKGKTLDEVTELITEFRKMMDIHKSSLDGTEDSDATAEPGAKLGDLEALKGVVKFPVRIKCATLSWITLEQALEEAS